MEPAVQASELCCTAFAAQPRSAMSRHLVHRMNRDFHGTAPTHGFSVRCPENVRQSKSETYETTKPQLTPDTPKAGPIDTNALPAELAEIVTIWPDLPDHIKAAITTLVQAHGKGGK
jgi:hypothetical protein